MSAQPVTLPPPPPPEPSINDVPLLKVGLHKPARDWLAALPSYKPLGAGCLFYCSQTRTLILNKYEGKLADPQNNLILRTFWEVPDRLYLVNNSYMLMTKLQYYDRAQNGWCIVGVSIWNPWQTLTVPYEDATGRRYYETANGTWSNMLSSIGNWSLTGFGPPPPIDIAPMPAPGMGSDITTLSTNDFSELTGYVRFTQNQNGTLNFRSEVTWISTNETWLEFRFPVPFLARGKSFLPVAFCPRQTINATVTPRPNDNTMSVLSTSAWTEGAGVNTFVFEANSIP